MRARTVVFRVVAGRDTLLETELLSAGLQRCRAARHEGLSARIEQFRPAQWPPQIRTIIR